MTLPLGRSPRLTATLIRINQELDELDRELDMNDEVRKMREWNEQLVTEYIRNWFLRDKR